MHQSIGERRAILERYGYRIGPRDRHLDPGTPGDLMVVEPRGDWALVGDDLDGLIATAFVRLLDLLQ